MKRRQGFYVWPASEDSVCRGLVFAATCQQRNIKHTLGQIAIQTINPNKVKSFITCSFFNQWIAYAIEEACSNLKTKFETVPPEENLRTLNMPNGTPRGEAYQF